MNKNSKKRFFFQTEDMLGQSFYRSLLPGGHLQEDGVADIDLYSTPNDFNYDGYVYHRLVSPGQLNVIEMERMKGKIILWETDDDIFHVPHWNPCAPQYNRFENQSMNKYMAECSSHIMVSTNYLKSVIVSETGVNGDKIVVLPNFLDTEAWPKPAKDHDKIRLLWAGSGCHLRDLDQLVTPLERILDEYGDQIQIIFMGDIPEGMCEYVRIQGNTFGFAVPAKRYKGRVGYVPPVTVSEYAQTLSDLDCDIAFCPLTDEPFNRSKSNLKQLEYTMAGCTCICTDLEPYHDFPCLLVKPGDGEGWYNATKTLIDNVAKRDDLYTNARAMVESKYSWRGVGQDWKRFFESL